MRRFALLLVFVVGCKKKEEPVADPTPTGPPPTGHSVTKVGEDGSGAGSAETHPGSASGGSSTTTAQAPADAAGPPADAQLYGGNGKPAYKDDQGHIHGPGGPIFMGRGPDCTGERDHCLREGVWFAVGNIRPGSIYRATPAFEFENVWYDFREQEVDCQELFKTKVAKGDDLQPGEPVIWMIQESVAQYNWINSESDALTSSRWEAGIIDEPASSGKFRVKGWDNAVQVDTARVVLERKKCPNAG